MWLDSKTLMIILELHLLSLVFYILRLVWCWLMIMFYWSWIWDIKSNHKCIMGFMYWIDPILRILYRSLSLVYLIVVILFKVPWPWNHHGFLRNYFIFWHILILSLIGWLKECCWVWNEFREECEWRRRNLSLIILSVIFMSSLVS